MKEIKLSQQGKHQGNFTAFVDDEDYTFLIQWRWYYYPARGTFYAARDIVVDGKRRRIRMHRIITGAPTGLEVDHKDHNGLNNQKSNLRICTKYQNRTNYINPLTKGLIGVQKVNNRFRSRIMVKKKEVHLGYYDSQIEAAKARDEAAKKYFGEFANLNFKL